MKKWSNLIKREAVMLGIGPMTIMVWVSCAHKLNKYSRVIDTRDVDKVIEDFQKETFETHEKAAEWICEEIRNIRRIRVRARIISEDGYISSECEIS